MKSTYTRRQFIQNAAILSMAATSLSQTSKGSNPKPYRAAIIGHTDRGDYGHGLDVALTNFPEIEIVAVADPSASGRAKAAEKSGAPRQYENWKELLKVEKPNLVCHASRWSEQRHEIGMAALEQGAHLFTEKPFTRTLRESDELLLQAHRKNLKIAVAHQMRLAPSMQALHGALKGGLIGELLQIRGWGKQDDRAGGEDMLVLGTHLFDLMRFFAGDVQSCMAHVTENGRGITARNGRSVNEQIGPVAGRELFATFVFQNGITANFTSHGKLRQTLGAWGIELLGSGGAVRILAQVSPTVYLMKAGKWETEGRKDEWVRWEGDPGRKMSSEELGFGPANRRVVQDLLAAIKENREPVCSGLNAAKAVEMVMGVYHSALNGTRVPFPLTHREHPLKTA